MTYADLAHVIEQIRIRVGKQDRTAVSPVGYVELSRFLSTYLPLILEAVAALKLGFTWAKAKTLAEVISRAVKDGLPSVKDQDAAALVEGLVTWVWKTYVVPALPWYLKMVQASLLALLLEAIEGIYRSRVKPTAAAL